MQPPQDDTVKRGEMPGEQMPESEPAQTVLKQLLLLAASILILLGGDFWQRHCTGDKRYSSAFSNIRRIERLD